MFKTIERLNQDQRVKRAWSEATMGDGYYVELKSGFADLHDPRQPIHTIHEWTTRSLLARMRGVKPCACQDCKPEVKNISLSY